MPRAGWNREQITRWRAELGLDTSPSVIGELARRDGRELLDPIWAIDEAEAKVLRTRFAQAEAALPDDVIAELRAVHADVWLMNYIGVREGRPVAVVVVSGDQRAVREDAKARSSNPQLVEVIEEPRRDLTEVRRRIESDRRRGFVAGELSVLVVNEIPSGELEVWVLAPTEALATAWTRERYGEHVKPFYLGPTRYQVMPTMWKEWRQTAPDVIEITFRTLLQRQPAGVSVSETDDEVIVVINEGRDVIVEEARGTTRTVAVKLQAPLGTRRVRDGSTAPD
jgi:hypothetical protein